MRELEESHELNQVHASVLLYYKHLVITGSVLYTMRVHKNSCHNYILNRASPI